MDNKKIIYWAKKNYLLIGVLIFALIIRLYFFIRLGDQNFWWDEAEYLNMARAWVFNIPYQFHPVRPILFSLIISFFFKLIPGSEFLPRFFLLTLSVLSVFGVYLLGKETFNKKVGLIAAFFMSINYINLFHTFRILVDIPALTFFIFSAFFFYKYFKYNKSKFLYWAAVMTAIGTLFKLPVASILLVVLVYLLITEKLNFLKRKEIWIAGLIFLLVLSPYLIWGYFQFGGFVITKAMAFHDPALKETGMAYVKLILGNVKGYLLLFPSSFSMIIVLAFIGGLFLMRKIFYGFDILFKGKETEIRKKLKRDLFLFLLFIIPFIIVARSLSYVDIRILLIIFPIVLIIAGLCIVKIYDSIEEKGEGKEWKLFAIIFLIVVLSIASYSLKQTNDMLLFKKDSYKEVKQAGIWLKENTIPTEAVITTSVPQIRYYSERETFDFTETQEEFELLLKENPQIKYYILSVFEQHRDEPWMYSYPQEKELQILQLYYAQDGKNPLLGIYKLR